MINLILSTTELSDDIIFIDGGYSEIYTGTGYDKVFVYHTSKELDGKRLLVEGPKQFGVVHSEVTDPDLIDIILTSDSPTSM